MTKEGTVSSDKLFKSLTRSPMLFGVSFSLFSLNIGITMVLYILTSKIIFLLVLMPGMHFAGYLLCFHEPLFVELFMLKNQKCNISKNSIYYGGDSYDTV